MRMTLDDSASANQIRGYRPGKFTVGKRHYETSILICANKLLSPWTNHHAGELTDADFTQLYHCKPTIIIIGTGEKLIHLSTELAAAVQARNIGLEVMDTAAACRTYNVLISENRDVVAGLLI